MKGENNDTLRENCLIKHEFQRTNHFDAHLYAFIQFNISHSIQYYDDIILSFTLYIEYLKFTSRKWVL